MEEESNFMPEMTDIVARLIPIRVLHKPNCGSIYATACNHIAEFIFSVIRPVFEMVRVKPNEVMTITHLVHTVIIVRPI